MRLKQLLFLFTFLSFIPATIEAQLIVVKQVYGTFKPLTSYDVEQHGKALYEIIHKYQWPTCLYEGLTEEEKSALLVPDKLFAQEDFIEAKIHALGQEYAQYRIVFVPTCFYELVTIRSNLDKPIPYRQTYYEPSSFKINTRLKESILFKDMYSVFQKEEEYISMDLNFYINNRCAHYLFSFCPEFSTCSDSQALFFDIRTLLLNTNRWKDLYLAAIMSNIADQKDLSAGYNIVKQVMLQEYYGHKKNKQLVLRGTYFKPFEIAKDGKRDILVGSPLWMLGYTRDKTLSDLIKTKELDSYLAPYSISFGSSLFASWFASMGSCPFHYILHIARNKCYSGPVGFGIFVDKKEYVKNRNNKMFILTPFSSLANLMTWGTMCHPRATAAVRNSRWGKVVRGIGMGLQTYDEHELILVKRDPLEHAQIFHEMFVNDGFVLSADESPLSFTQIFIDEMLGNRPSTGGRMESLEHLQFEEHIQNQHRKAIAHYKKLLEKEPGLYEKFILPIEMFLFGTKPQSKL